MPLRFAEPATEAYRFPLTIRHLLDSALTTASDRRIVYRDQGSWTYREFAGRVGRLASLLADLGAEQGMTIAVMDWDSHRYLEAYFAVPMMGAVLQTVNVRLPAPQVAYTLNHAKAEILLVHHDFFPLVEAVLPSLPGVKAVVAIMDGTQGALPAYAKGEYEALSAAASPDYPFEDFDENAVATTFYTTGTTGNPKGVCFTHRQLVLHTLACNAPFGAADGTGFAYKDVYMPLTPMFHVHAWGVPYVATMLGMTQVYPGRYEPEMLCRLHAQHKVTYSHCVPTILRMLLDAAEKTGTDVSGWTITVGGSALSPQLCAEGRRKGMRLIAGYGMSETGPLVSVARIRPGTEGDDAAEIQALTATVPAPLISARIVDDDMNDLPHDGQTRGELVLRAPWLTPCYTGDAKASETLWHGGWMHTQDIATIDPDGYIRIRDRLKDVIKTGGEWIDSIQLEELVATAEGVVEVAVVAMPDAKWGERPLAVVVVRPGAALTLETLNAPIEAAISQGTITRYAKLERFAVVEGLPRTSVGKIDKKLIRATHADNAQAGVA
ncbi:MULTISPECIES: long-chain-fatty-acid--CoA ligase [unclassified Novosphingobium]|uniref:long-chain-fatty-acid--CoA ligase n=1 Tax=unclassified Novosphingobium TaxID=2644732 RepID=UPI00145B622D|nr:MULTISPECIES: long-chain-fatty-acid--CoA ligase [unclassified Novosphingobium]MBB3358253.1 fatty-acyl-CoA synthase [Novosphingobium sp. BK256]MBB3374614.1 fatty-acyl-CoA synthase [Novosphingobium sp. BK280]MBB3379026.1 fatty-acyl-CoA synthase [Novosphingobium sp. BK258]MBB3420720.1 fatty-acyl-CoA synthase [Novosphingobium sp. BK267]MBB3448158.1 fatty-acyl-CoA synthase [Novosphingobium sp. BK352]